ncbi:MAG: hypothetical protein CR217_00970 [Beijerinckiaceae bacterium]|nr:MAG: hypothetical protein CR217_00970 [Beijerinckiaceae bacterium]
MKSLLFQKSNGVFELIIWNNVTNWNFAAGTPIAISPTNVGITFGSTQGVLNVYDPIAKSGPALTVSTTNTVTIALKEAAGFFGLEKREDIDVSFTNDLVRCWPVGP